jgi:hypothetical protein
MKDGLLTVERQLTLYSFFALDLQNKKNDHYLVSILELEQLPEADTS